MTEDSRICPENHIGNAQTCFCGASTKPYTGTGYGHVCPECGQVFLTQFEECEHWQAIHGEREESEKKP